MPCPRHLTTTTNARAPLAVTDCLNFGNPQRPEVMWEFVEAIRGLGHGLRALDLPVVSGNVSLYNETGSASIHPTPTCGTVGLLEDVDHAIGMGLPESGELCLLGSPRPTFGASAYARCVHGVEAGAPPPVHWEEERALHALLREGAKRGLILAAHDAADGGLAVALAEMVLAADLVPGRPAVGVDAWLATFPDPSAHELGWFGETHGCAWVVVDEGRSDELIALGQELGCSVRRAGGVGGRAIVLRDATKAAALNLPIEDARRAWRDGFTEAVGLDPVPEPV